MTIPDPDRGLPSAATAGQARDYPRDLIGYGRNPPHAQWPGAARIALQFVLNVEEGGESCVLHGDAASETFLSEIDRRAGLPGATPEHGVDLRVRRARRLVADPARIRTARPAAHRVRRLDGAAAQPRAHAGFRRTRPRGRLPFVALDPLPAHERSARARAHRDRHADHPRTDAGPVAARLVHRPRQPEHQAPRRRPRRLPVRQRLLRRRPAVLDARHEVRRQHAATPDRALHARHERHALRRGAGFQHRRALLPVPEGRLRRALCRGRSGRPGSTEDAEHRHALPAARPPGALSRAAALSGPRAAARQGLDLPAHRHRAPLDGRRTRRLLPWTAMRRRGRAEQ